METSCVLMMLIILILEIRLEIKPGKMLPASIETLVVSQLKKEVKLHQKKEINSTNRQKYFEFFVMSNDATQDKSNIDMKNLYLMLILYL